jgi:hypothetical protein
VTLLVHPVPRLPRVHVLAGPMRQLPYGALRPAEGVRDLAVREIEHLTQHERRPLER